MIKDAFIAIGTAARGLLRSPGALAVLTLLYLALLASLYLFFATREATTAQLVGTAVWAVAAPLFFLLLQAAAANFAEGVTASPAALLKRALADFVKILLVSLPLIALCVLVVYLLNKLQARFPVSESASSVHVPVFPQASPPPRPLHWQEVVFTSLRLLLLGVLLPLAGIQMWLSIARDGLMATFRKLHRVIARVFAQETIVVYAVGLFVFGVIPYVLIFSRTPLIKSSGVELVLFGLRFALAFVFTLWGWMITLGALARINAAARPDAATAQDADVPTSETAPAHS
ncbi:MAG: hypothetical protein WCD76_21655 [Pyrinomonadaceae bacterium]